MRRFLFPAVWGFIFLAAVYDSYFAWQYREVLHSWELNPLVRWAAERVGLVAIFGFKFAALVFALALAWHCRRGHHQLGHALTVIAAGAYALLMLHYVVEYQKPPAYAVPGGGAAIIAVGKPAG